MNIETLIYPKGPNIRTCAALARLLDERLKAPMMSLDAPFDDARRALATVTEMLSQATGTPAADRERVPALALEAIARVDSYLMRMDAAGDEVDDRDLREASRLLTRLQVAFMNEMAWFHRGHGTQMSAPSRRTRWAAGLAVRLLPPADRERYRQEFASELADLPRIDQAPHAIRLVFRAWPLRRSLKGKASVRTGTVIVVAVGGGSLAWTAAVSWPAAVLGGALIAAVLMTINSNERTRRLASLIRATRGRPGPARKD